MEFLFSRSEFPDRVGSAKRRVSIRCRAEGARSAGGCESRSGFIYETFRDLNSVSEVSMREQGQHASDRGEVRFVWFVSTS